MPRAPVTSTYDAKPTVGVVDTSENLVSQENAVLESAQVGSYDYSVNGNGMSEVRDFTQTGIDVNGNASNDAGVAVAEQHIEEGLAIFTEEERLWSVVRANSLDFNVWIAFIEEAEKVSEALDTFDTAVVSPIYYAMFTSLTIFASVIMFKDYSGQSASSLASELCGFITMLSGTTVLHSTRESDPPITDLYSPLSPRISWHIQGNGELWKQKDKDGLSAVFVTILRQDYFT